MALALLGLRLAVGLAFVAHGAQKLFGAFGGPGIDGTAGFSTSSGCGRASSTRGSRERPRPSAAC